jgi:hypothetical protein
MTERDFRSSNVSGDIIFNTPDGRRSIWKRIRRRKRERRRKGIAECGMRRLE